MGLLLIEILVCFTVLGSGLLWVLCLGSGYYSGLGSGPGLGSGLGLGLGLDLGSLRYWFIMLFLSSSLCLCFLLCGWPCLLVASGMSVPYLSPPPRTLSSPDLPEGGTLHDA